MVLLDITDSGVGVIVDFHVHYGRDVDGSYTNIDVIKQQMEKNKIERVVLFPFNNKDLIEDSRRILELSRKHKFITPFLRFDPSKIQKQELRDLIEMGFKGIKLHPRSQNFDPSDPKFKWIFEDILNYSIPILIHSKLNSYEPNSHPLKIVELAKRFPDQIFIAAHCAGGDFQPFEEISKCDNLYVETSIYSLPIIFEKMHDQYGFDRFLYGSDFPYNYPEIELAKIRLANISQDLKEKILWKNAEKVLK